jgi:hypothetical protein
VKRSLRAIKNGFFNWPIAVLGGGPSLPSDLLVIPEKSIKISVNHHATKITDCNYMVFLDDPYIFQDMMPAVHQYAGRRFSRMDKYSDFERDCRIWSEGNSSTLACWFACHLGGNPVLLCGMDCYQGEAYFYERTGHDASKELRKDVQHHIRPWLNAKIGCSNPENIKAVSGPLITLFGGYNGRV